MTNNFSWENTLPVESQQTATATQAPPTGEFSWENTLPVAEQQPSEPDVAETLNYFGLFPSPTFAKQFVRGLGGKRLLPEETEREKQSGAGKAGHIAGEATKYGLVGAALNPFTAPLLGPLGVTGAIIEGGLIGAGGKAATTLAEESRLPTAGETAKEAALGGVTAGGLQLAGRGYQAARNFIAGQRPPTAPQLAQQLIGPGEGSGYEASEEALRFLQGRFAPPPVIPGQPNPPGTINAVQAFQNIGRRQPAANLAGRVTPQQSRQLGITANVIPRNPTVEDRVLGSFNFRFHNSTEGGNAVQTQFRQRSDLAHEVVNNLYAESRALNESFAGTREDLVASFLDRIGQINRLPSPSTTQRKLRQEMRRIANEWTVRDAEGNIIDYVEVPNQVVIDQIQALRSLIDSDFMHGDATNIFRPAIGDLAASARNVAIREGAPEAAEALDAASTTYRQWQEIYNNPLIQSIRDPANNTPVKNLTKLLDIDNFNIARPILEQTPQGQQLLEGARRKIADKYLKKFYENPRANQRELAETLAELEAVLTPEQITNIRSEFARGHFPQGEPRFGRQARAIEQLQQAEQEASQYLRMDRPEQLDKMMDSRTGIRELRRDLQGTDHFNNLRREKTREIVYSGKYRGNPTGRELHDVLNTTKNRELLIEMHGEEAFNNTLRFAEELGEQQLNQEARQRLIKKLGYTKHLGIIALLI